MKPRIEHKLSLDRADYPGFLRWMQHHDAVLLHPDRVVTSTYFDTAGLRMFFDTDEGLVPRKKVRIRCYGTHGPSCDADHQLETKQTTEQQRLKQTRSCPDWQRLQSDGINDPDYGLCLPTVTVTYRRSYYQVHDVRVTIDQHLRYRSASALSIARQETTDPHIAIEIKASADADLDRLANAFPFPRAHFSKYERAVRAVYPRGA